MTRPEVILINHTRGRGRLYGQMMMLPEPPLTLVLDRGRPYVDRPFWPRDTCLCGIRILVPDHVYEELLDRRLPTAWSALFAALDESYWLCGVRPDVAPLPPLKTDPAAAQARLEKVLRA